MSSKSKYRRVENIEDFTQWDWGPPEHLVKPFEELELALVEWLKEWSEDNIVSESHEKSCASGAAIVFEEFAENGDFILAGTTDKGLLVKFQGTDTFGICDELDIVGDTLLLFADPQHFSAHLRRLADAIDAASPIAPNPATPT